MRHRIYLTLVLALFVGIILTGCGQTEEEKAAAEAFNAETARIQSEIADRDQAIKDAKALLGGEKQPLQKEDKDPVKEAIEKAQAIEYEEPDIPKEVADINAKTEELKKISFVEATQLVKDSASALETGIKKCELVTAPTEEYVINCLKNVKDAKKVEAVTEDNDPNDMLGKQGGYTAAVYFSSPLVPNDSGFYTGDPIEDGTDGGGCVEVFSTQKEAETREAYLAQFDSTGALASGSHKVIGTCLVRTSNELKKSKQDALEAAVIEALTTLK